MINKCDGPGVGSHRRLMRGVRVIACHFLSGVGISRLGRFVGWKPGRLARNTALATWWQGVRLALQVVYLILVARLIGVQGYGHFAGIVALAASFSPLAGVGFNLVMVQQVARHPEAFASYWGRTLMAIFLTAPVLVGAMSAAALDLLPVESSNAVFLLLAGCELFLVPMVTAASNVYLAYERLGASIFNFVLLNCGRVVAMAALAVSDDKPDLTTFAVCYLVGTAVPAAASLFAVSRTYGRPKWAMQGMVRESRQGIGYSLSGLAFVAHAELDKALLLRLGGPISAGTYSVAMRVVSAVSVPVVAYVLAVVPRLFRTGEQGIADGAQATAKLLYPIIAYGALAGTGIFLLAPLLPALLGDDFAGAVPVVRMLAFLPLITGVSSLLLAVLTCSDAQRIRVSLETTALGVNVAANVILIPPLGTLGAVIAILASQVVLAALAAATIYRHLRGASSK
jgi:O-antigen/teichoic acid export membrane protein